MYLYKTLISVLFIVFLISCTPEKNPLPEKFLNYTIDKKLTGEEAKTFVNKLHFNEVAAEKNEIGFYKSEKDQAIIYITYYDNSEIAHQEEKRMTEKISPENSVFRNGEYIDSGGKNVYRCFGMGQTHFVFNKDKRLFWISVNTIEANNFLKAYLDYLK